MITDSKQAASELDPALPGNIAFKIYRVRELRTFSLGNLFFLDKVSTESAIGSGMYLTHKVS